MYFQHLLLIWINQPLPLYHRASFW
ncbi:MAG: hypothetical protein DUD32_10130 [Lactobacillus sp.]|nr:MAG: hypothetical protein DUD32_10130 [Lactobacillus sp.]